eukprot:15024869-Alexandrium_andersonii.AAC.1
MSDAEEQLVQNLGPRGVAEPDAPHCGQLQELQRDVVVEALVPHLVLLWGGHVDIWGTSGLGAMRREFQEFREFREFR